MLSAGRGFSLLLLSLHPLLLHSAAAPVAAAAVRRSESGSELQQPPVINLTGSAFKYLGFWAPGTPAEMEGFTNLAFANDAAQAIEQQRHGIQSLLKSHGICLNYTTKWAVSLYPDCEARLAQVTPMFAPLLSNGTALGFFLGDELLWNGLSFGELQSYVRLMRAAFPAPVVLYYNEAYPSLLPTPAGTGQYVGDVGHLPDRQLLQHVPRELDWFSVDVYPDMFSAAGLPSVYHSFVLPKMLANQSLVLVPPFYTDINVTAEQVVSDCDDSDCDAAMARWAKMCVRWVTGGTADAQRIVAAMPYLWTSLWAPGHSGSRVGDGKDLPAARSVWEALGRAVVARRTLT